MVTISYVRLVRDEDGTVIDSHDANQEFARLRQQIADYREMLDSVRRMALQLNEEILKG